jgi:hypothetical protein
MTALCVEGGISLHAAGLPAVNVLQRLSTLEVRANAPALHRDLACLAGLATLTNSTVVESAWTQCSALYGPVGVCGRAAADDLRCPISRLRVLHRLAGAHHLTHLDCKFNWPSALLLAGLRGLRHAALAQILPGSSIDLQLPLAVHLVGLKVTRIGVNCALFRHATTANNARERNCLTCQLGLGAQVNCLSQPTMSELGQTALRLRPKEGLAAALPRLATAVGRVAGQSKPPCSCIASVASPRLA